MEYINVCFCGETLETGEVYPLMEDLKLRKL